MTAPAQGSALRLSAALLEGPCCPLPELVEVILKSVDVALQLIEGEALGRDEHAPFGVRDVSLDHDLDPRERVRITRLDGEREGAGPLLAS